MSLTVLESVSVTEVLSTLTGIASNYGQYKPGYIDGAIRLELDQGIIIKVFAMDVGSCWGDECMAGYLMYSATIPTKLNCNAVNELNLQNPILKFVAAEDDTLMIMKSIDLSAGILATMFATDLDSFMGDVGCFTHLFLDTTLAPTSRSEHTENEFAQH